jgi:uncharacterized membrane protein
MGESAQASDMRAARVALPGALAERRLAIGVALVTAAAGAFLFHQLMAWPPHEDETLALFVGRHPLDELFQLVLEERGGAPLHFLLAWCVVHAGLGLEALRALSALFALGSLPLIALLGIRLAGRRPALIATALAAAMTPATQIASLPSRSRKYGCQA